MRVEARKYFYNLHVVDISVCYYTMWCLCRIVNVKGFALEHILCKFSHLERLNI